MTIRTRLAELNLNQRQLASNASISEPYLSQVLSGRNTPSLPVASRLAAALGWSLNDLVAALPPHPETASVAG